MNSEEQRTESSFLCWFCEKNLADQRYIIRDGFAVCLSCYDEKYAPLCRQCHEKITIEMQALTFADAPWHRTCFNCSICYRSLINEKFAFRNQSLFCRRCSIDQFAQRCYRCNRPIESNEQCTQYEDQFYHQSCFVCHACHRSLMNVTYRRADQYYLCLTCHRQLASIYCIKCRQAIATDGILFDNHPFHRTCFLCTHCGQPLGNEQRFVQFNDNAFCRHCWSMGFDQK